MSFLLWWKTLSFPVAVARRLFAVDGAAGIWKVGIQLISNVRLRLLGYLIALWLLCTHQL